MTELLLATLPLSLVSVSAAWHHSVTRSGIAQALTTVDEVARAGALPFGLRHLRFTMHASALAPLGDGGAGPLTEQAATENDAIQHIHVSVLALGKTCAARGIALDVVTIEYTWVGSSWCPLVRSVYP